MPYLVALLIRGLRDPTDATSAAPVAFTTGEYGGTLPAALTGATLLPWLDARELPPAGGTSDPVSPVDPRFAGTLTLVDEDDQLSRLFSPDFLSRATNIWRVSNDVSADDSDPLTLRLTGSTAPTNGRVYWLEGEALKSTSVSAVSNTSLTWNVSFSRGECGSYTRAHRLLPSRYQPGGQGLTDALEVWDRPPWGEAPFDATLYALDISGDTATQLWARHLIIQERPTPTGDGRWRVKVEDRAKPLQEKKFADGKREIALAHCVQVENFLASGAAGYLPPSLQAGQTVGKPLLASLWLTRAEAESFFNEPLHVAPNDNEIDGTAVDALETLRAGDSKVFYLARLSCGGHEWLFVASNIDSVSPDNTAFVALTQTRPAMVKVSLAFLYARPEASCQDAPISFPSNFLLRSRDNFNAGWAGREAEPLREGEEAPKLRLWVRIKDTPVKAALRLLQSDTGASINGTYDVIFGGFGAGMMSSQLNVGTASGAPIGVSMGTQELLKLDELLPAAYDYIIDPESGGVGDWLANVCRLHLCLFSPVPSTGAYTLRRWYRKVVSESPTALNLLVGQGRETSLSVMPPMRALSLDLGYDPLEPEKPIVPAVSLQIRSAKREDIEKAPRIRAWVSGTAQDLTPLLAEIVQEQREALRQLQAESHRFSVPGFLPDGARMPGDIVTWTDSSISVPTVDGHGVSAQQAFVIGAEFNPFDGVQRLTLLEDAVNTVSSSAGKIAPTLRVEAISSVTLVVSDTLYQVVCQVTSVGETSFNISTAHGGFWTSLDSLSDRLRILRPQKHNPLGERRGWLEASAAFSSVSYSATTGTSGITLLVPVAWERGGGSLAADINDLFVAGETFICLSDRRASSANPEGVEITPPAEQLSASYDALKFAPGAGLPFDSHYSTITT